jgi:hypothetical protein
MSSNGSTLQAGNTGRGCNNVISFAGYVARNGRKESSAEVSNLIRFIGCPVVDLASRRHEPG